MATKKTPTRRAPARKPAARTKTTARARSAAAKPAAKAVAKKTAAKKPAARKRPAVEVVSKLPIARRFAAAQPARVPRLAVFIDVENTSSEDDLFEVLDALHIDRAVQPTEVTAVGNWRAISQRLGRRLAGIGAQLVHSAPATGVRDWSDLWIAVAAGCWLGTAQPGDVLEIVSNDRAFDAVGDAAAARGVVYHRLLLKRGARAAAAEEEEEDGTPKRRRRSRGGRRRRGRNGGSAATPAAEPGHAAAAAQASGARHAPAAARTAQPKPAQRAPSHPPLHDDIEAHGATRDQIVSVIARLAGSDATRWINLDVLEKALKAEGFARPPGSPRLVTRLRMLKDVEIDSHGRARLAAVPEPATEADAAAAEAPAPAQAEPKKRRRRRKPGEARAAGESADVEAAPFAAAAYSEPPAE